MRVLEQHGDHAFLLRMQLPEVAALVKLPRPRQLLQVVHVDLCRVRVRRRREAMLVLEEHPEHFQVAPAFQFGQVRLEVQPTLRTLHGADCGP